ncbi:unnamed protein product [Sphacelaria rigidula]
MSDSKRVKISKREGALMARLAAKEQEVYEVQACARDLYRARRPVTDFARQVYTDPAINVEFQLMTAQLGEMENSLRLKDTELKELRASVEKASGCKMDGITHDKASAGTAGDVNSGGKGKEAGDTAGAAGESKVARASALVLRCQKLEQENEELAASADVAKVAQLTSEKAVAEAYAGELKIALEEAYEYIEQLEEEREVNSNKVYALEEALRAASTNQSTFQEHEYNDAPSSARQDEADTADPEGKEEQQGMHHRMQQPDEWNELEEQQQQHQQHLPQNQQQHEQHEQEQQHREHHRREHQHEQEQQDQQEQQHQQDQRHQHYQEQQHQQQQHHHEQHQQQQHHHHQRDHFEESSMGLDERDGAPIPHDNSGRMDSFGEDMGINQQTEDHNMDSGSNTAPPPPPPPEPQHQQQHQPQLQPSVEDMDDLYGDMMPEFGGGGEDAEKPLQESVGDRNNEGQEQDAGAIEQSGAGDGSGDPMDEDQEDARQPEPVVAKTERTPPKRTQPRRRSTRRR